MTAPVLIVDNEKKFCKVIKAAMDLENIQSDYVFSGEAALEWLKQNTAEIVLTDLRMDGMNGLELLRAVKAGYPTVEVIIMTAFATQKNAIEALKEGAFDYLIKPFEMDELVLRIRRILRQKQLLNENRLLKSQRGDDPILKNIIGRSNKMKQVYRLVKKAAESETTVLIRGESGTGKELVAENIHANGPRAAQPFVALNCAALPESLLESELFGYEKGAFTGANQRKAGKFEFAGDGTIFLDEIGDMSLATQAKLLRVLENKEIVRLGGNERVQTNARVLAATHRNLEQMVEEGIFRQDLYYRLNVFPVLLPPLRERKEDIPELVNHFLSNLDIVGIDRRALRLLIEYDWPGNVRELQNVIERAAILADSVIKSADLSVPSESKPQAASQFALPDSGFQLDQFEKELVEQALEKAGGNKTRAAEILGISRRRLYSLMERFKIHS